MKECSFSPLWPCGFGVINKGCELAGQQNKTRGGMGPLSITLKIIFLCIHYVCINTYHRHNTVCMVDKSRTETVVGERERL